MQQTQLSKPIIKVYQGNQSSVTLALNTIARKAMEEKVLVIDAASSFQPHDIMKQYPESGQNIVQNIQVARPISALQLVTVLDRLDLEASLSGAKTIIVTGFNVPFLKLKKREIKSIIPVLCNKFKQMKKSGVSFYVGCVDQDHCLHSTQEVLIRQIMRNHLRNIVLV